MLKLRLSSGVDAFFSRDFILASENICIGVSDDQKVFVKIEIKEDPQKANTIRQETQIMKQLNAQNCISCPLILGEGSMTKAELLQIVDLQAKALIEDLDKDIFEYNAQECIRGTKDFRMEDIFISMIEQQKLGVFQGDIDESNIKFDPETDICYLLDYDQAELLTEDVQALNSLDYFKWCDQRAHDKYEHLGTFGFLDNFGFAFQIHFKHLFRDGSFNIGKTSPFLTQETTMSAGGIYHSFAFDSIFADGERNLDARQPLLDQLSFAKGERVLDVGCNAGLLSMYLHDRGCKVTSVDLDRKVITGARYIAHICDKQIRYHCLDLDEGEIVGQFDTVMLFSVIHHTQHMVTNARKIAQSCKRIIIECRLVEDGAKPIDGNWYGTTKWSHPDMATMENRLQNLFPNFKVKQNLGIVDRDRFIIELVKDHP